MISARRAPVSALLACLALTTLALAGCVPTPPAAEQPPSEPPQQTQQPDETSEPATEPSNENDVSELTSVPTAELLVGQCIAGLPVNPGHGELTAVPCADMHNAEVIITTESDTEEFPGDDEMQSEAERWCSDLLPAIANGVPDSSLYAVLRPTEESWDDGDRFMVCFIRAFDAYYTGSFVGGDAEVHTD